MSALDALYNECVETFDRLRVEIIQTIVAVWGSSPQLPLVVFSAVTLSAVAIGMYVVVTARSRAEKRTASLLRQIDAVAEKLNDAERIGKFGSFIWNFEYTPSSFWSEEMYTLSGLVRRRSVPTIEAMIGAIHEVDRDRAKEIWDAAKKKPGSFSLDYRTRAPSGEVRHVRVDGITTLDIHRKPYSIQGVIHDVTKETEVDKAKSEFVSLASHQLKTPLTTVRWHCEALLAGAVGPITSQQTSYIKTVQEANQRMINMVNDLLNVSRIELNTFSLKPQEIDVRVIAESVIQEQEHIAKEKQLTLRLSSPQVPHIYADQTMTRMIFQNLISNAIKYTPKGGSVECEIGTAGSQKESIFVRISDTGIGIPKEEQGRVFEKLHRATNAEAHVPDGTGLGLYVVKMILDHAGGNITFESVEGKGTTFYVSIPLRWKNTEKKSTEV